MNLTSEQQEVVESNEDLRVNAVAGSGKSYSLLAYAKSKQGRILYLAYNKVIQEEISRKAKAQGISMDVLTTHSLAYRGLKSRGYNIDVSKQFNYTMFKVECQVLFNLRKEETWGLFKKLESYLNYWSCTSISFNDLLDQKHVLGRDRDVMNHVFQKMCRFELPVAHDFYLKIFSRLQPQLGYDYILVDESQDLSAPTLEIVSSQNQGIKVFVGDENQCQPAGTMIQLPDGSKIDIKDIKVGTHVTSYLKGAGRRFIGYYDGTRPGNKKIVETTAPIVTAKQEREAFVDMFKVSTATKTSFYTHNHRCIAKFNESKRNAQIVYLMQRGDRFRIGTNPLFNGGTQAFGLSARARNEKAEKAWVLKIFDDKKEAYYYEQYVSSAYCIPQMRFEDNTCNKIQKKTDKYRSFEINDFWEKLTNKVDLLDNALSVLYDHNKYIEFPMWEKGEKRYNATEAYSEYAACNLFSEYMDMAIFEPSTFVKNITKKPTVEVIKSINIERNVLTKVYSLEVSKTGLYVADGILTHNSIYGFRYAMNALDSELIAGYRQLYLTQSFRYTQRIANIANEILSWKSLYSDYVHVPIVGLNERITVPNEAIITRTNYSLLNQAYICALQNHTLWIEGDLNLDNFHAIICDFNRIRKGEKAQLPFLQKQTSLANLKSMYAVAEDFEMLNLVKLVENFRDESVRIIPTILSKRVNKENCDIVLTNTHKSKGLEYNKVIMTDDFLNYNDMMLELRGEKPISTNFDEELNLLYVALTRTTDNLVMSNGGTRSELIKKNLL